MRISYWNGRPRQFFWRSREGMGWWRWRKRSGRRGNDMWRLRRRWNGGYKRGWRKGNGCWSGRGRGKSWCRQRHLRRHQEPRGLPRSREHLACRVFCSRERSSTHWANRQDHRDCHPPNPEANRRPAAGNTASHHLEHQLNRFSRAHSRKTHLHRFHASQTSARQARNRCWSSTA